MPAQEADAFRDLLSRGNDYFGVNAPSPALGSDVHAGDKNITISPTTTITVSGGADPQAIADRVGGLDNSWADLVRNAGATVR